MLVGWIKIHRKILDHWVAQDPELLAVWIRLLSEANHSTTKKMFNGALTTIDRGQVVFGLEAFSAKSGVSIAKLRRYLKLLETDGMISRQKTNKYSIITIACYEQYQSDDRQNASKEQAGDKQTTSKQQHRKNVKNEEECKEEHMGDKSPKKKTYKDLDYSSWPSLPKPELLADWMEVRRNKKASNTQTAINGLGKQLQLAVKMGFTVEQCIEEAVTNSWKGFRAEWMSNSNVLPATGQRTFLTASDMPFPSE